MNGSLIHAIALALPLAFVLACDVDDQSDWDETTELEGAKISSDIEADDPQDDEDHGLDPSLGLTTMPSAALGYWEYDAVVWGCGTCVHTVPEPDRDGRWVDYRKRWCWLTADAGSICDDWIYTSMGCLDTCV